MSIPVGAKPNRPKMGKKDGGDINMGKRAAKEITEAELDELLANSSMAHLSPQVVSVEVVEDVSVLSEAEKRLRKELEEKVEQAFYIAGQALKMLRDKKLYRDTHRSFEAYCRERFCHSRQKANFLIVAAKIYQHLTTIGCHLLPANERQIRPLSLLEPAQQGDAWLWAVEAAGGKNPSGRQVKRIVDEIRASAEVANPYQVGDVCSIWVNDNPELRGKHKCWGIVCQVQPRSCLAACWDGQYQINIEHLKPLDYSPAQRQELAQLEERLRRFQDETVVVESLAYSILEKLGKLERSYLTALEEKLLRLLEV